MNIAEIAQELTRRLTRLFLRDENDRRPIFGTNDKLQNDPHFKDYLTFGEYFDGDTGRQAGAMHQTGWTALVAKLLQPRRTHPVAEAPIPAKNGKKPTKAKTSKKVK